MGLQRRMQGLALLAVLAACGRGAGGGEPSPADTTVTDTLAQPTGGEASIAKGGDAEYHASDYAFDGPQSVVAGVRNIRITNSGNDVHHVQLLRLEEGHTAADVRAAFTGKGPAPPMPDWATRVGGVAAVGNGGDAVATVVLEPGRYAAICEIPASDGEPHVAKGMALDLEVVEGEGTDTALPAGDATFHLRDFTFEVPKVAAGLRTIRVKNVGTEPHELQLFRLHPGKRLEDMFAWAKANFEGPIPAEPLGGVSGLSPNGEGTFTAEFEPGRYAVLCFIPTPDGKQLHVQIGMAAEFEVV